MCVGLLGLQGAFRDHIPHLERLGVSYRVVRDAADLEKTERIILPGGESTVMSKFLNEFGMTEALREKIRGGTPVWGICAGCILLAETVDNRPGVLRSLPAEIRRNAYGRQRESIERAISVPLLNRPDFPAIFIRAPKFISLAKEVQVLAVSGNDPVFVRTGSRMATTFHPELTDDPVFHEYFLGLDPE